MSHIYFLIANRINVHTEHIKHSKSQDTFLKCVKENDQKKKKARRSDVIKSDVHTGSVMLRKGLSENLMLAWHLSEWRNSFVKIKRKSFSGIGNSKS